MKIRRRINSTRHSHRRASAFTLTEMLFLLVIMGVAAVLSTGLFLASIRAMEIAPQMQAHLASIDRMTASLRRDVWSARSIDLPDDRTIVLAEPDSTMIRWRLNDTDAIRTDSAGDHRWPTDVSLHARRRDGVLVLSVPVDRFGATDEIHFVSQSLAQMGGTR